MKNTRPLVLVAAALALFVSACSQPSEIAAPTLEPQLGPPGTNYAVGVAFNKTGHLYGLTEGSSYDCDDTTEVLNQQAMLSRYDRNGNLLWEREIYGISCDTTNYWEDCDGYRTLDVGVDGAGNAYSLTYYQGESCDAANVYYSATVTKLNAAGTWLWSQGVANATAFAVDANGNVYTVGNNDTGYEYCYDDIDNDPPYAEIVSKYNSSGTLQWRRALKVGTPTDVAVSGSGSVYVVGTTGMSRYSGTGSHSWAKAGSFEEVVISGSNLYTRYRKDIRKYDGTGKQLWLRTQGGLNTLVLQRMAGDLSGNIYLSGKYRTSNGDMNAVARRLSPSGNSLWTKTYGTAAYDDARGIASYDGSEIYLAGETQGKLSAANYGGSRGYLYKMNRYGNRVWIR